MRNEMNLQFSALSQNGAFARIAIAAFVAQLDPTVEELSDIKTAVSEAVTNAVIHGYESNPEGIVYLSAVLDDELEHIEIEIRDHGVGITDVEEARQPLYTSKPELERSGMGFTIMENFMDELTIQSQAGQGTSVKISKFLSRNGSLVH